MFTKLSNEVFTNLGMNVLKDEIRKTRDAMDKSVLSSGLLNAVKHFFTQIQSNLSSSGHKIDEITEMMTVMYRKFSTEHGLALSSPMPFSLDKYRNEIALIESIYHKQFGATTLMTAPKVVLMQKFFDSIASRVKQSFLQANRDVEAWLKVVMAPLEAQINEHKLQLKRRRQSIERIHVATESLEEKVASFEQMQAELDAQKKALQLLEQELKNAISTDLSSMRDAA